MSENRPDPLMERLNRLDEADFIAVLGGLYEHSPWVAAAAFASRPFVDRDALREAMQHAVLAAPRTRQLELIRAHPDLAGKLARAGALESHSTSEQTGLGLDRLSDDEYRQFDELNTAYRERFAIPFIIAVRAQTRESVIAAFKLRLHHELAAEIATALDEIGKIAAFRLADLS